MVEQNEPGYEGNDLCSRSLELSNRIAQIGEELTKDR